MSERTQNIVSIAAVVLVLVLNAALQPRCRGTFDPGK